jgi:hypothetical protein
MERGAKVRLFLATVSDDDDDDDEACAILTSAKRP